MIFRLFLFAIKNLFRNLFISIGTTIVATLLFFFISILFFLVFITDTGVQNVNNRLSVTLTIKDNIGPEAQKITELKGLISALHPSISVEFLSRQDALRILTERNPKLAQVLEGSKENPLPSSLQIRNIPLAQYTELQLLIRPYASILMNTPDKIEQSFTDYRAQYERIQKVVDILLALKSGVWLLLLLFAISMFTILSQSLMQMVMTWSDELQVIRLVGGSPVYLYGPFMIQGMIIIILSEIGALGLLFGLLYGMNLTLIPQFPQLVGQFIIQYWLELVFALLFALLIACFAAFLAVKKTEEN